MDLSLNRTETDYSTFSTELNLICKEIFEKCVINKTSSTTLTSSMLPTGDDSSYVLCADVINYINQGLTSNKLMTSESLLGDCTLYESSLACNSASSSENNESIKYLKRLFCDHFKIDLETDLETQELKLDLISLNAIFQVWIKKLSLNTATPSNDDIINHFDERITFKQNLKKEYKNNKELRNSLKKIRKSNLSQTNKAENTNANHLMLIAQDDMQSLEATSSSSSLPSVSLNSSDDDGLLSMSKLNSERNSNSDLEHLELNDELLSENFRLKQTINDLKMQLSNAEDLNSQMGHELEQLNNRNACLNRVHYELNAKMNTLSDENEQNSKCIEQYKTRIESLMSENKSLATDVKMFKSKCSTYENEIFNLKSQIETNEFDKENLMIDLNEQKSLLNQLEKYNTKLEQNLVDAKSKYIEQEQLIEKLNEIIQDKRKENENLNEKNNILADKFKSSNSKLLRKNFFSNEALKSDCTSHKNKNYLSPSYTFGSTNVSFNTTPRLANETQTECDEAESLMNIYIAANLNDNTFHLSANEANFFSEQFEFQNKLEEENLPETTSKADENILEQLQLFLNKIDQIRLQYEELKKYDTLDSKNINCNLDLDKTYLAKSFKTMLETFFGYLYDKNKNEIKQNLENIVNQSKKFSNTNKQLSEQFSTALKKIRFLQNQVNFYKANNTLATVKTLKKKPIQLATSIHLHGSESILNDNLSEWIKVKDQIEQKQKCYSEQNLLFENHFKSTPNSSAKLTSMSIDCLNENLSDLPIIRIEKLEDKQHLSSSSNSSLNSNELNQQQQTTKTRMLNKALSEMMGCKSFSNFDANDADVDDDEATNECKKTTSKQVASTMVRSILAAKRYSSSCNQIRTKPSDDLEVEDAVATLDDHVLNLKCGTCQERYQISLSGSKLRSILSLDLTLDSKNDPVFDVCTNLTSSLISNQRDASTQTSEPSSGLLKNSKKQDYLMRHQLTRDSGIDSDHQTQYKFNHLPFNNNNNNNTNTSSSSKIKKNQIMIPISKCDEKTESENLDDFDDDDDKQSKEFLASSTRDNSSVDIQNSSSIDDPDDLMVDIFKRNELSCPLDVKKKSHEVASNRRLMFKNSNKTTLSMNVTKRQHNFYSFEMPNDSISPSPTDKQFDLETEPLERHSSQIESSKPMIHFTNISKLSDQLQNESRDASSKLNVTIDDILNVVDEPVPVPNRTPLTYRNRNQMRRHSSISTDNNSSINEETIYTCYEDTHLNDHKLKQLESNFNQIAMAHHSDEQVVENNIELYKDKYKKANTFMDLLFDEITTSINKMLSCLINEQPEFLTNDTSNELNTSKTYSSLKYKKLMQENLNLLNKTIERVRKNLICLVTTSSTISGLKQEAHLSELFKITISYVKELKRSLLNNSSNKFNTSRKDRSHHSAYKRSLTSYESLEISDKPETESKISPANWLATVSLVKSCSTQSYSNRKRNRRSNVNNLISNEYTDEKLTKHDYYDDDNFSISDNLNLLKNASYTTSSSLQSADSLMKTDQDESIKTIDEINKLGNQEEKKKIVDSKQSKLGELNKRLKSAFKRNMNKYEYARDVCKQFVKLVQKDSYKRLRLVISAFLIVIAFLFLLCALFRDVDLYEIAFNYFINNFEIKNPSFAGRSF